MDILIHLSRVEDEFNAANGVVDCSCNAKRMGDIDRASVHAELRFYDGSVLVIRENIDSSRCFPDMIKYSYQYMKDENLVFRYDNTPHYRNLATFPHHKHVVKDSEEDAIESTRPSHRDLFREVGTHLPDQA